MTQIRYYWKPGCSSCLRTKEFLKKQGIEFESINTLAVPEAIDDLRALGARGLPVIRLGDRFTLCQSIPDVLKFLGLDQGLRGEPLPPAQLFEKLDVVLASAAQTTRQFSSSQLNETFRDRPRTKGALAFHIFRVVEMGLGAARGEGMDNEGFNDLPPDGWSGDDIADWGMKIRDDARAWWGAQEDRSLKYRVPTYYGNQPLHDVLERTVWHAAQHTRQLGLMLEEGGTAAAAPLSAETLRGLPLPEQVWG